MNYIGCDCHISTLDCAVVNERGQETKKQKMHTGVKGLMEFVKSIPKPRKIIIEDVMRNADMRLGQDSHNEARTQ